MHSPAASDRAIKKVASTALIATTIEWYDFFIYGTAAALVFPKFFFPDTMSPFMAVLTAFSTFAVGFVARPVGGVVFGHFGDRVGRKKCLVVALIMMAAATVLIGFLPSYHAAGWLAPCGLVILRFVQGLAVGGQWGGATLLVTETAPKAKRGYYGSFAQAGGPIGTILANLVFLFASVSMPHDAFLSWGWRIPFLASVILIPVAMYIELRVDDSPAFKELVAQRRAASERVGGSKKVNPTSFADENQERRKGLPIVAALRDHPREITLAAGTMVGIQASYYVLNLFAVAYATNPSGLGLSSNLMLGAVLVGAVGQLSGVFCSGATSDRYGRRPVLLCSGILLGVLAFAFFPLIETRSAPLIIFTMFVSQFLVGGIAGPTPAFMTEIFSTRVRYSAASLSYQIGAILGGGLAPMIATGLYARFGSTTPVAAYMACSCLIAIVCAFLVKETAGRDLEEE